MKIYNLLCCQPVELHRVDSALPHSYMNECTNLLEHYHFHNFIKVLFYYVNNFNNYFLIYKLHIIFISSIFCRASIL